MRYLMRLLYRPGSITSDPFHFNDRLIRAHGAGLAGALFGAGWCFWVDAVLVNAQHGNKIPFLAVSLVILLYFMQWVSWTVHMRSDLNSFDSFDSATFNRQRLWLFIAYVVSFGSIIGACVLLVSRMSQEDGASYDRWVGWAAVFQVTSILGAGLVLFMSRGDSDGYDDGYTAF